MSRSRRFAPVRFNTREVSLMAELAAVSFPDFASKLAAVRTPKEHVKTVLQYFGLRKEKRGFLWIPR